MNTITKKVVLTNIQALRAFAAINVVFYHIFGTAKSYGFPLKFFAFLETWGRNGVDIFFVISGFIMVYIQHAKPKTPAVFFANRITRIVPLYWTLNLVLVLMLLAIPNLFKELIISTKWILSSLFFISRVAGFETPLIFPGWTLELEMFFYLLFAVSLFARHQFKSFVITAVLIIMAVSLAGLNRVALEFIFGMLLGLIYINSTGPARSGRFFLILGTSLLLSTIWIVADFEIARFIVFGVPSALIVYGAINVGQLRKGWATTLGDASYSIYLVQMFSIPAFYKLVRLSGTGTVNTDLLAISCLVATCVAGLLTYLLLEKRIGVILKYTKG